MFRSFAFAVLVAVANLAHAEPVAVHAAELSLPDLEQADPAMTKALEARRHATVQLPGFSHHFDQPRHKDGSLVKGRKFNERHWAIGAQFEEPMDASWEGWVRKVSFGVMKDSLDAYGLYTGVVWQKRVYDSATFSADLGGGAFLFYRTLQFGGKHLLVPAVLPVLSGLHKSSGIGANVVLVPQFKTASGTMPGVVFLQFTKTY